MHLLLVAALVPSLALAAVPSSDGTYTACYLTQDGRVRLIDPAGGESCRKHEKKVTWTQKSSLTTVSTQRYVPSIVALALPVGDPNCPQGGTQLTVDGTANYVCNGTPGAQGIQGPKGNPGTPATRLWAYVSATGTLRGGGGVVASSRLSDGNFSVTFNQSIVNCAATAGYLRESNDVSVNVSNHLAITRWTTTELRIYIWNTAFNDNVNIPFGLIVVC